MRLEADVAVGVCLAGDGSIALVETAGGVATPGNQALPRRRRLHTLRLALVRTRAEACGEASRLVGRSSAREKKAKESGPGQAEHDEKETHAFLGRLRMRGNFPDIPVGGETSMEKGSYLKSTRC